MERQYEARATLTIKRVEVAGTLFLTITEEDEPPVPVFEGRHSKPTGTPRRTGSGHFAADETKDVPLLDPLLDREGSLQFEDCGQQLTLPAQVASTRTPGTLEITIGQ